MAKPRSESSWASALPAGKSYGGGLRRRLMPASRRSPGDHAAQARHEASRRSPKSFGLSDWMARLLRLLSNPVGDCAGLIDWLRRRLRAIAWKQWKRGTTRFVELRRGGVGRDLAAQTAGSPHGPWRLANSPALSIAMPIAFFDHSAWLPSPFVDPYKQPNRRIRTRTSGGVGGAQSRDCPLSRFALEQCCPENEHLARFCRITIR